MNLIDERYKDFALVQEMMETPDIIGRFDYSQVNDILVSIRKTGKIFLTGEGSSRIFPAKNMVAEMLKLGMPVGVFTEYSRQASEYNLADFTVIGASNSGRTKEVVSLFDTLSRAKHPALFGLTAHSGTLLESFSTRTYVLSCGTENAVAATKSVAEQGLFYQSIVCAFAGDGGERLKANQQKAAEAAREALEMDLDPEVVETIASASIVYFAGRNNGVAEELALKTNETTRKKSGFLEGTYAVHGIEEVMNKDEVVIIVDPYPEEIDKFREVLVDGVGLKVIAMAPQQTSFPTIVIPSVWGFDTFLQLLAGWNILVSVGVATGIDLDKPERARKVGNEFIV